MINSNQPMQKPGTTDKSARIGEKMKEKWSKLSDDDIKLYDGKRDQFFAKLKEKHSVTKEDAEKACQEMEASCATSFGGAEKTGAVKAA